MFAYTRREFLKLIGAMAASFLLPLDLLSPSDPPEPATIKQIALQDGFARIDLGPVTEERNSDCTITLKIASTFHINWSKVHFIDSRGGCWITLDYGQHWTGIDLPFDDANYVHILEAK